MLFAVGSFVSRLCHPSFERYDSFNTLSRQESDAPFHIDLSAIRVPAVAVVLCLGGAIHHSLYYDRRFLKSGRLRSVNLSGDAGHVTNCPASAGYVWP